MMMDRTIETTIDKTAIAIDIKMKTSVVFAAVGTATAMNAPIAKHNTDDNDDDNDDDDDDDAIVALVCLM